MQNLSNGYKTIVGERGTRLSGGERQRVAIARAFLTDPSILILDDSVSAIDSETEEKIGRALEKIMENRTTLIITHRLHTIRAWRSRRNQQCCHDPYGTHKCEFSLIPNGLPILDSGQVK